MSARIMAHSAATPLDGAAAPDRHWLGTDRARAYSIIMLVVYLGLSIYWVALSDGMIDPRGEPLTWDFLAFYAASEMILDGNIRGLYDFPSFRAHQLTIIPGNMAMLLWNYPPTYVAVVAPLSLLPYLVSFAVWTLGTFALYLFVIHRILPSRLTLLAACAFPATFWNATHGHNGFLATALLGAGLLVLETRPKLAGLFIGLLTFKPQIGVLIPVALLFSRRWTTIATATVTTLVFAGLATLITGIEGWALAHMAMGRIMAFIEAGLLAPERLASLFAALRSLNVGLETAYALQIASGLGAAAVIALVWKGPAPFAAKAAVLAAGIPLATPYGFDYDLQCLAVAMAFFVRDALDRGWMRFDREILAITWFMPLIATAVAEGTSVHLAYPVCLAFFIWCARRAWVGSEKAAVVA